MKDIMDKLGIAKGTIYHFLKLKGELLEALIKPIGDDYIATIQTILDETKGTALERFQVLIALATSPMMRTIF